MHRLGGKAVEFWSWWDKDLPTIRKALAKTGVELAAMCTKMVPLTRPERREEYIEGLSESIETARSLHCGLLISQVGEDTGEEHALQYQSVLVGLRIAAELLEKNDMTLVVEPLNPFDHPGYFLVSSREGFSLVEDCASPRVRLLFDLYHQQRSEGNLLQNLLPQLGKVAHLHAAGAPERCELGRSEIDYRYLLSQLREAGYRGMVGLEYFPKQEDPEAGLKQCLGWL